jgi:hypothetical protein
MEQWRIKMTERLTIQKLLVYSYPAGVDPTKLFFFANEEFFRFSLVSLHFRYMQKKIIGSKMT